MLLRRDFALLFLVLFVVAAGNTALQSVLPTIGRAIGMPDVLVAVIFSFSALLWVFSAPYWAEESDRRGRKALVMLGMAGYAVSKLICAIVILLGLLGVLSPVATFVLFALGRALFGLFGSASNPAAQAYVAARTSPAERTRALAALSSAFGLGTIVGPAVAPFLVMPAVTLAGPMFAFAAIALLTLWGVWRYLPGKRAATREPMYAEAGVEPTIGAAGHAGAARGRQRLSWRDPRILPFALFGLMIGNAQAASGQTLGFLIIDKLGLPPVVAQASIGLAMMAGAVATLLAQWALIPMFDMQPRQLMRWGAGLAALGSTMLALAGDLHAIAIAFALASLGYGFARPGFNAGASLAVGPEDQGAAAGTITAVNGAAFVVAPALGIALYQIAQPLPYLISAIVLIAMLVYAVRNPLLARGLDG